MLTSRHNRLHLSYHISLSLSLSLSLTHTRRDTHTHWETHTHNRYPHTYTKHTTVTPHGLSTDLYLSLCLVNSLSHTSHTSNVTLSKFPYPHTCVSFSNFLDTRIRHAVSAGGGIFMAVTVYGRDSIHFFATSLGTYLLCMLAPRKHVHIIVWVLGFGHLLVKFRLNLSCQLHFIILNISVSVTSIACGSSSWIGVWIWLDLKWSLSYGWFLSRATITMDCWQRRTRWSTLRSFFFVDQYV